MTVLVKFVENIPVFKLFTGKQVSKKLKNLANVEKNPINMFRFLQKNVNLKLLFQLKAKTPPEFPEEFFGTFVKIPFIVSRYSVLV